ncbi:mycothiol conjugate amidase Mca [Pseudoclavibacter chungangensis]|uniref:Mycothiol S-conjugate amidase n=2 Tax=Pseudoclavibacter chungangensis TaxID=587635 RepID=A0A7J5BW12_9MICO|nr:mycothiol conjugate amidase Mca [Pseudoclavibacter chungangensis]KAB1658053.1 mycothiol conjugate amidase Mca [Pseudoclavibacter chungangensis]
MAVHAHPDDESSKGAATYAAYADRGVEVMVVSCTGGEAGDILNPGIESMHHAKRDLAGLRRVEMAAAQRILGVEHRWLGYVDSGMAREDGSLPPASFAAIPVEISARPLIRLVREFRPHVLITYDENGGYPHPDHIRCHEVSMRAWMQAGTNDDPELGEPWTVSKLYYDRTMNAERAESMFELVQRTDPDSPLAEKMAEMVSWMSRKPTTITTRVSVGEFFPRRDDALRAHASQVAPDSGFFFAVPRALELEAYPYEDYQLVDSRVAVTTPESDLFEGVVDEGGAA